jgi:hypothetical protein
MNNPMPFASEAGVEEMKVLYKEDFGIELTHDEAREVLERLMGFIYLTEVESAIRPIREEIKRERRQTGAKH